MDVRFEMRDAVTGRDEHGQDVRGPVEHVVITIDSADERVRPATEEDKQRWKPQYEAFRQGKEAPADVEELRAALRKALDRGANAEAKLEEMSERLKTSRKLLVDVEAALVGVKATADLFRQLLTKVIRDTELATDLELIQNHEGHQLAELLDARLKAHRRDRSENARQLEEAKTAVEKALAEAKQERELRQAAEERLAKAQEGGENRKPGHDEEPASRGKKGR